MPKPYGNGNWQLYNIKNNPGCMNDLSGKETDRLNAMITKYEQYATENGVVEPDKKVAYAKEPHADSW